MSKLIMSGHSFGGGTAIAVAEADSRVKCVLTHDPWMWPLEFDLWGKFDGFKNRKVVAQNIYGASFHPCINKLLPPAYSGFTEDKKIEYLTKTHMKGNLVKNIKLEGVHHHHQTDRVVSSLLDLEITGSYGS